MFSSSVRYDSYNNLLPRSISPLLYNNTESENQFKCGHCQIAFALQEDLIYHLTVGNPEIKLEKIREDTSYTCSICNIIFTSFKGIMQHYGMIHLTKKDFPCKVCGKMFKNKHAVRDHVRGVHESAAKVICEICSKVCYNKYTHKSHYQKCFLKNSKKKAET